MKKQTRRFLQDSYQREEPMAKLRDVVKADINPDKNRDKAIATALEKAKAKNARLRLLKERNELYLF